MSPVLISERRGQTTIETAILIGAAVMAFVTMSLYVQRAYQGYLYSAASTHGPQFEPNNSRHPYLEIQKLEPSFRAGTTTTQARGGPAFRQMQDISVTKGGSLVLLPGGTSDLSSTPGGPLAGRLLTTEVEVATDWNVNRRTCYGDTAPCDR